jgi:pyrroloquinoline-quinone synthase
MNFEHSNFLNDLDELIKSKHLLKHPFYQAWSRGELSKECLKEYAKDYYQHVKAFPRYISVLHSRTEDAETRRILLQNLMEEEAGSPNHPELWKNFALALGVTESELANHKQSPEMNHLIATFRKICGQHSVSEGIASLYAYESQIPEICISKIDGLKKFYGMTNPKDWEYFSIHIEADKEHAAQERCLLTSHVELSNDLKVKTSTNEVLDVLWKFLSGMCDRHGIENMCAV